MAKKLRLATVTDIEKILLALDDQALQIKEIEKQYKSIQVSLDLIYSDRDILHDIQESIATGHRLTVQVDEHNEELTQEIKETVEETTEVVQDKVDHALPKQIASHINKVFTKEEKVLEKKPRWKRVHLPHFRFRKSK